MLCIVMIKSSCFCSTLIKRTGNLSNSSMNTKTSCKTTILDKQTNTDAEIKQMRLHTHVHKHIDVQTRRETDSKHRACIS